DLRHPLDIKLFLPLLGGGDKARGLHLSQKCQRLTALLMLHVKRQIVRQIVAVEFILEIFLDDSWIARPPEPQLRLPAFREKVLMLKENPSSKRIGWLDIRAGAAELVRTVVENEER